MSGAFGIPEFSEFPEFDVSREASEAFPDPKLVMALLIVGGLLSAPSIQRRFPELQGLVREMLIIAVGTFEDRQWTLAELGRYADALEVDSKEEYRDAGACLRQALEQFGEAVSTQNEYTFAVVFRQVVGAVEEVARQLVGDGKIGLREALNRMVHCEPLSEEGRVWLVELYDLRNTRRGLGHGAGPCPEYVASFALFAVLRGLEALIPSSALPAKQGSEHTSVQQ